MQIEVFRSKIHRAKVTQADLNYIGSITIDEALVEAAGMIIGEKVDIVNCNNGERLSTYIIKGERNSGIICLNGAAARKVAVDDIVIIIGYGYLELKEAQNYAGGTTVFVNQNNEIESIDAPKVEVAV